MPTKELHEKSRIAVYLRKSREEANTDDTLGKHRMQMAEYIDLRGFKNVTWFEEVGSAESISKRPIFTELLERVEDEEFDAVCVIAYDRLSRGSQIDAGLITKVFKESDTFVLTPSREYDFKEETSQLMSEFESLIARQEYRAITRRLINGKINATKQGKYIHGIPPYGYKIDKNEDFAQIDEKTSKVYLFIVNQYLSGESMYAIAVELNRRGIPSSKNRKWSRTVIVHVLENPFYKGVITYGKRPKDKDGIQRHETDESKIIFAKGKHTPLVDEKTWDKVQYKMESEKGRYAKRSAGKKFRTSSLCYCGACGYNRQTIMETRYKKTYPINRKCSHKKSDGFSVCVESSSIRESDILEILRNDMMKHQSELFAVPKTEIEAATEPAGMNPFEIQTKIIEENEAKIKRVKMLFVEGDFSKQEFDEVKEKCNREIKRAKTLLRRLEHSPEKENVERKKRWKEIDIDQLLFGDAFTPSEANRILKTLISSIHITNPKPKNSPTGESFITMKIKYK